MFLPNVFVKNLFLLITLSQIIKCFRRKYLKHTRVSRKFSWWNEEASNIKPLFKLFLDSKAHSDMLRTAQSFWKHLGRWWKAVYDRMLEERAYDSSPHNFFYSTKTALINLQSTRHAFPLDTPLIKIGVDNNCWFASFWRMEFCWRFGYKSGTLIWTQVIAIAQYITEEFQSPFLDSSPPSADVKSRRHCVQITANFEMK